MRLITRSRSLAVSSSLGCGSSSFFGGDLVMVAVDLGTLQPENGVQLYIARSRALDAYSQVEQSLSRLLSSLLGTTFELGSIVFFRITNANMRNRIFEDLLRKRFEDTYRAYWSGIPNTHNKRGLFTWIRQLDDERNKIVHWAIVNNISTDGLGAKSILSLKKPNFWADNSAEEIRISELVEFVRKADFVHRSLNMFGMFISGQYAEALREPWQEIFQQPCLYPPPDTHPLYPSYKGPETPHQPSEA
jgi:hypothetical protein